MKKNLLVTAVLSIICLSAKAQPEKGDTFIGFGVTTERSFIAMPSTFIVPKVGYFVNKHFAVGSSLFLSGKARTDFLTYNVGIRPFARYYFSGSKKKDNKKAFWFIEANAGINRFASIGLKKTYQYSYHYVNYGLAGGVNYYITPDISVEALLRLDVNSNVSGRSNVEDYSYRVPQSYAIKPVAEFGVNFNLKGKKNKTKVVN